MTPEENDILWKLYQDHVVHGRHHETLRATTTTVLLAVAAGVLGLIGSEHVWPLEHRDLPLALFLILLGLVGALFSAKYHERFTFHMNRAREYRNALDKSLPEVGINKARPVADKKTEAEYPLLFRRRLYVLWIWLDLLVAVLGVVLALSIYWPNHAVAESVKKENYDLVFAQITDPHMFDDGPVKDYPNSNGPNDPDRRRVVDNARKEDANAFDWAVSQINRLSTESLPKQPVRFVVITGDFGLEAVNFQNLKALGAPSDLPASCEQAIDPVPTSKLRNSPTFNAVQASEQLAKQLASLKFSTVYLVPGNNDLAEESVRDQFRFRCFIGLVQQQLNSIRPEPLSLVQLDTTPILIPPAGFAKPGYWLLGLNSASFKDRKNYNSCSIKPADPFDVVWNSCPDQQMNALLQWKNDNPNSLGLVFTHIPDLRDPFKVREKGEDFDKVPSGWDLDKKPYDSWQAFARSPQVVAIFAGHFHDADRSVYHPIPDAPSRAVLWNRLSIDPLITKKTWVAPPLAEKFQTNGGGQARGFTVVRLQKNYVLVDKCWYPEGCKIAP